ncbi:MAG: glycoside hydrolase family 2, partial [Sphingomonadales bacterium]
MALTHPFRWPTLAWMVLAAVMLLGMAVPAEAQQRMRVEGDWASILFEADGEQPAPDAYAAVTVDDRAWRRVAVPHNWQGYAYNRQLRVGARHGVAWYRKTLTIAARAGDERIALRFEGVNSYATIWVNGQPVGKHGGGLTSFAVDITAAVRAGENIVAVRVDNPAGITDLPWVSGDDKPENGFAEGSQPFGIFRPVWVERSAALRVRPYGAYAWGAPGAITSKTATLTARVELENRSAAARTVDVEATLIDDRGRAVTTIRSRQSLAAGEERMVDQAMPAIRNPRLWSPDNPYLHRLRTRIRDRGRVIDETVTPFGIRTVAIVQDAQG